LNYSTISFREALVQKIKETVKEITGIDS
jgi:hypothetical protein